MPTIEPKIDSLIYELREHRRSTAETIEEVRRSCEDQRVATGRMEVEIKSVVKTTDKIEARLDSVDRRAAGFGTMFAVIVSALGAGAKMVWDSIKT